MDGGVISGMTGQNQRRTLSRGSLVVGALVVVAGIVVVWAVLGSSGALAPAGSGLADIGPFVRFALPAARTVHDLAAALTTGAFVLGAWLAAPEPESSPEELTGTRQRLVRIGFAAAVIWACSSAAVLILTASDVTGIRIGERDSGAAVISFVSQTDLGRALGMSLSLIILAALLAFVATTVAAAGWAAVFSILAVLPVALGGHAAGSRAHVTSTDSLAIHLVAVCLWVGGLAALVLVARRLGDQLPTVASRYSTLAGGCFAVVAASGLINAWLRLGSLESLASGYGALVVAKAVALILLGFAGWTHRRLTLQGIGQNRRWFHRLAAGELVVMGATTGLAVALSRSAPPARSGAVDRVSELLGYPAPPPLTAANYLTAFHPDLLWLIVSVALAAGYVAGVLRLRRRGDSWSWLRTTAWLAGCGVLVFVTSGGPGIYGRLQFSMHMLQHMSLMIMVPLLFVLGAPVTLALRALGARTDGSFGPREVLLKVVHSDVLRVLSHPAVAAGLLIISLVVFYYTWLFPMAMITHPGHVLMAIHFLIVGYLFVWSLIGIDPGPTRPPYPLRVLVLLITMAFHAVFGVSLMASTTLLAPTWWYALGQAEDAALVADQQAGGGIAWAAGDVPSLLLMVALVVSWFQSDRREARRLDRQADRDGGAELRSYNERLAELARRDQQ
jgi:cytochrome c oxidase assembly factor CtaG/putative copper export protein